MTNLSGAPFYNGFGYPNQQPTAQNPTLVPQFDPLVGGSSDGSVVSFVPVSKFLQMFPRLPATGTITFTGSATAGDTAEITLFNNLFPSGAHSVSTIVSSTDTLTTIAQRLADLITTDLTLMAYGVSAQYSLVSSNPTITLSWPGPLGNITAVTGWSYANSVTSTIGGSVTSTDVIGLTFASAALPKNAMLFTLTGTCTNNDVVSLTFSNPALALPVKISHTSSSSTLATTATALASSINSSAALTAIGMTASANGAQVSITWNAQYGQVFCSPAFVGPTASEVFTLAGQAGVQPSALAPSAVGTETITITGSATTGDVVTLTVASSQLAAPVVLTYTVVSGDSTTTLLATHLTALLNANPQLVALGVSATSALAVITISWTSQSGFMAFLASAVQPATENGNITLPAFGPPLGVNQVDAAVLTGTPTSTEAPALIFNDVLIAGNPVTVSYTILTTDTTLSLVAIGLAAAVNANTALAAVGISAQAVGPIVYLMSQSPNQTQYSGTNSTHVTVSLQAVNASLSLTYTAAGGNSTTTIATALKNAINADVICIAAGIIATSSSAVVTIFFNQQLQPLTILGTVSAGATETNTIGTIENAQLVTVGGSATARDILYVKVSEASLPGGSVTVSSTVTSAESTTSMAAGLAAAINDNYYLEAAGITATSSAAVLSVFSEFVQPTLAVWAGTTTATTITMTDSALTTGDYVNVAFTNASLAGGKHNVQYQLVSGDSTLTLLAAHIAAAINADATCIANSIAATSALGVVSVTWPKPFGPTTVAANTNGIKEAAISGATPTAGEIPVITITDSGLSGGVLAVPYTVQNSDTNTLIAAGFKALINASAPLIALGITATNTGANLFITSASPNATTYARTNSTNTTITLSEGPTETATVGGGALETLTVSQANIGSEILTAVSPLAGGAGPVIPTKNFQFAQNNVQANQSGFPDVSPGVFTDFWTGKPQLVDFETVVQLANQGMPVI
jgi:hypothetical protein